MFEDEARIGQKGRICHRWYTRGKRPPGRADQRYTFAYVFAAVEPGTDNAFALVMPEVSTLAMQIYLDKLSATIAVDEHTVLVLDQAGWHGANDLEVPANISLLPLPPRSPELNPVERLWLFLKERFLSHRLLDSASRRERRLPLEGGGKTRHELAPPTCAIRAAHTSRSGANSFLARQGGGVCCKPHPHQERHRT